MKMLRRKYFIYPEIQKPMLRLAAVTLLLMSLFQVFCFFAVMKWLEKQTQVSMHILIDYRVFGVWRYYIIAAIIGPMVLNLSIVMFMTLFISNKFAGPIFRIEKEIDLYLKEIKAGASVELKIKLRQNDYLKVLAAKINSLTHRKP